MKICALIIDDEKMAREGLISQLKSNLDIVEVVGEAGSVNEGIQQIKALSPDLVFLDVEMPDGTGFDLLREIGSSEFKVVFVTAFDQYAIQAIKFSALDYLLKPIDPDELVAVVKKAEEQILNPENFDQIKNLLHNVDISNNNEKKLAVKCVDSIKYLPIAELCHFAADGSYTKISLSSGKTILASKMLKHFEELLKDFPQFIRIHRSTMINIHFVKEYYYSNGGSVLLASGETVYPSEDRKKHLLRELEKLN